MSAISTISVFQNVSKDQLFKLIEIAKAEMEDGKVSAFDVYTTFKNLEDIIKKLKPTIETRLMEEIEHEQEVFTRNGFDVEKAEVGTRYDYSNDPKWNEYKKAIDSLRAKQREHEAHLKTLKQDIANLDTGEVAVPPIKTSKSFIKLKRI